MIKRVKKIWKYRELLLILTAKDFKVGYKETILGVAWAVFVPLATMIIFTFVFSRLARFNTGNIPYPIFVYCGILPWTFFATSLNSSINSLLYNASLITKAYFPKEVLPLSAIFSNLIDFFIGFIIFIFLLIFYRVAIHPELLLVIVILAVHILLTIGLSLILSAANIFYRDVQYILQVFITLWMFLTPVFYPVSLLMNYQWLFYLNPMIPIIGLYRFALIGSPLPPVNTIIVSTLISTFIFIIGFYIFDRVEHQFAKCL